VGGLRENAHFVRVNSEYISLYLIYNNIPDIQQENPPFGRIYLDYIKLYFMYNKKMLTSFAFSKPTGKYILSYTLKKGHLRNILLKRSL